MYERKNVHHLRLVLPNGSDTFSESEKEEFKGFSEPFLWTLRVEKHDFGLEKNPDFLEKGSSKYLISLTFC